MRETLAALVLLALITTAPFSIGLSTRFSGLKGTMLAELNGRSFEASVDAARAK